MMMKQYLVYLFILLTSPLLAQQDRFHWRVGVQTGVMNYFGDLNSQFFPANQALVEQDLGFLSYGLAIEKRLKQASALRLSLSRGQFIANDRAINFSGDRIASQFSQRALNAKTEIQDIGLTYVWYTDNDHVFGRKALIAPYFGLGVGWSSFEVFGDLLAANGNRYHYWSDGTIRTAPESSGSGDIIEQDGQFETKLTGLQTEKTDYSTTTWFGTALIGLKFRLNARLNLNLEYQWNYTTSDFLDDVSGTYQTHDDDFINYAANPSAFTGNRGGNSHLNDSYSFTSISLHYNFIKRKHPFRAPQLLTAAATYKKTDSTATHQVETITDTSSVKGQTDKEILLQVAKSNTTSSLNKTTHSSDSLVNVFTDTLASKSDSLTLAHVSLKDSFLVRNPLQDSTKLVVQASDSVSKDLLERQQTTFSVIPHQVTKKSQEKAKPVLNTSEVDTERSSFSTIPSKIDTIGSVRTIQGQEVLTKQATSPEVITMQQDLAALKAQIALLIQGQALVASGSRQPLDTIQNVTLDTAKLAADSLMIAPNTIEEAEQTRLLKAMQTQLIQVNQHLEKLTNSPQNTVLAPVEDKPVQELIVEVAQLKAMFKQLEAKNEAMEASLAGLKSVTSAEADSTPALYTKTVIYFDMNAFALRTVDEERLNEVIKRHPTKQFILRGYTDQIGNANYNAQLAMKRALAVKKHLIVEGVNEASIHIDFAGPDTQIPNHKASYGRRVEVIVN